MIHKIFTVFDEKALAYLPPFVLPETGQAIRSFADCVNSSDHMFGKHPEDYTLFQIGVYDDKSGVISELDTRSVIGSGVQYKRPPDAGNGSQAMRDLVGKAIEDGHTGIGLDD